MEAGGAREGKDDNLVSAIGPGVVIVGEVTCDLDLQVDGRITGDVRCPTLLLNEGAVIEGSIRAERVRISGRVDGSIHAGDLAIEASGFIEGDASYTRLKVSPGGRVRGRLDPRDEHTAVAEPKPFKLVEVAAMPQPIRVFGE